MSTFELWHKALTVLVLIAGPFLLAELVVGLVMALLQTATQLQESVLAFVPKLVVAVVLLVLAGPYLLDRINQFSTEAITVAARGRDQSF